MTRSDSHLSRLKEHLKSGLIPRIPGLNTYPEPSMDVDDEQFSISNPWVRAYLDTRAETQLEEKSIETYQLQLQEFITFLEERDRHVINADRTDLIEYIELCVDSGNRQSTIEGKLTTIKELYKFIRLRTKAGKYLTIDPIEIDAIDVDEYNTPPPIQREPLTREELRRLFDAMDSYRTRLMTIVAAETGLRNSDIRNLRIDDVDFENATIHVRDPKNGQPYDAPISHDLAAELEIWCDVYQPGYGSSANSEFLFPGQNQEKISTNEGLNKIIKRAAEDAGLQETIGVSDLTSSQKREFKTESDERVWHRVTVHTLRHTCLTLMKEDGVPLQYRQLVANHSDPTTTQHYSHGKEEEFTVIRNHFNLPL